MKEKTKVGKTPKAYEASPDITADTFKQSETPAEQLYTIVYKGNRSREIVVNGERLIFHPGESRSDIPESIANSPEFKNQDFSIKKQGGK